MDPLVLKLWTIYWYESLGIEIVNNILIWIPWYWNRKQYIDMNPLVLKWWTIYWYGFLGIGMGKISQIWIHLWGSPVVFVKAGIGFFRSWVLENQKNGLWIEPLSWRGLIDVSEITKKQYQSKYILLNFARNVDLVDLAEMKMIKHSIEEENRSEEPQKTTAQNIII